MQPICIAIALVCILIHRPNYLDLVLGSISIEDTNPLTKVLSTGLAGCISSLNPIYYNSALASSCRNGSLSLTLEELMTKFAISMLSSFSMV